jgi:hypothetical protein
MHTVVGTDGDVRPTFAVGEKPDQTAAEHPLFPGIALRHGISTGGWNWELLQEKKNGLQIMQTLYLAITETRELNMSKKDEADIYAMVHEAMVSDNGLTMVNKRYMQAAKLYKERKALGNLPSLRVKLSKTVRMTEEEFKRNNPFNLGINRRV